MRRTPKFDRETAARIIAEAVVGGDKATCSKHGLSERTLQRWRKRLEGDAVLAAHVADKKAIVEADWADALPGAIRECINFIAVRVPQLDSTPEALHAVAGAMKLLTETGLQKQMLDVRLARQAGQAGAANGSLAGTGGNVVALRPAAAVAHGVHPGGEQKISSS